MDGTKRRLLVAAGTVAAATAVAGAPAAAQVAETTTPPAGVEIETFGVQTLLDTITVTPNKVAETAIEVPAGVTVVSTEDLDLAEPSSPSEVLAAVPGVATVASADDAATAINIRGLQDFGRVAVTIDGARQNFQRSGHNANGMFYLDPEVLRQVDVVRGPVSNIYGSGAIGGVVSFQTKDARDVLRPGETAAAVVKSQYDTNGDGWLESATAAVDSGTGVELLGNIVWRDRGDYRSGTNGPIGDAIYEPLYPDVDGSARQAVTGLAKATYRPSEAQFLTATYLSNENDFVSGEPGSRRDTNAFDETIALTWDVDPVDDPLLDFTASVYRTSTDAHQVVIEDDTSTTYTVGDEIDFEIVTTGFDIHNTSVVDLAPGISNTMTIGGDLFRDEVETADPAGTNDLFTPSGERTAWGAFVQDKIAFGGHLDLIGALRFDAFELTDGTVANEGSQLSPKSTVVLKPFAGTPWEGVELFGTYAEGYRAPAVTETLIAGVHPAPATFDFLPNPELEPEIAHNWEGGINVRKDGLFAANDALRFKATWFTNTVENFIEGQDHTTVTFPPCPPFCGPPVIGGYFQYQNIAEVELTGYELEGVYDAGWGFVEVAAHQIRSEDQATGLPLSSTPPDRVVTTLGLRSADESLTYGVRFIHVAAQDRVTDPALAAEGYDLVDLFASWDIDEDTRLALNLENVFDRFYEPYDTAGGGVQDPGEGFGAKITFTKRFGG